MIIHKEKKIGLFFNPKVASVTTMRIFTEVAMTKTLPITLYRNNFKPTDPSTWVPDHVTYDTFYQTHGQYIEDIQDYKFYCFFRNPIQRLISAYRYYKRHYYFSFLGFFYGYNNADTYEAYDYNEVQRVGYDKLPQRLKDKIETITLDDFIKSNYFTIDIHNVIGPVVIFRPQTDWLDHPQVELLDYRWYENELRRFIVMLGSRYDGRVWVMNDSVKLQNDSKDEILTKESENIIRKYYEKDFTFFENKGIIF